MTLKNTSETKMCKNSKWEECSQNHKNPEQQIKEIDKKSNLLTTSTSLLETIRTPSLLTRRSPSLNVPDPVLNKLGETQIKKNPIEKSIKSEGGKRVVQEFRDVIGRWDGELEVRS